MKLRLTLKLRMNYYQRDLMSYKTNLNIRYFFLSNFRLKNEKETQLQQLIQRAAIDPSVTNQLLMKIQQSIEAKNGLVKNLRYSIHHATKVKISRRIFF